METWRHGEELNQWAPQSYKISFVGRFSSHGISLLASALLFGVVNYFNLTRPVTCHDCFFRYGFPFTFFREGGFAGGGGIVWSGVAGDSLVIVALGASLSWSWTLASERLKLKAPIAEKG
jgi:hypothetical protein